MAMLYLYAHGARPVFDRLSVQWRAFRHGDMAAGGVFFASWGLGLLGMAISLAGLVAPWRRQAAWRERALWCIPVALGLMYMPVHLEPRYLVPGVPLICILAAAGLRRNV